MKKNKIKVLFLGNPGYGGFVLEELLKLDVEVVGVFHETKNIFFKFKKFIKHHFSNIKKIKTTLNKIFFSNKGLKKWESLFDEKLKVNEFNKDVIDIAKKENIPIFDTSYLFKNKCLHELLKLNIDVLLVASFSELIPNKILQVSKIASVNIHPSLLPKYRCSNPEFYSIYNGDEEAGITFHLMNNKFDSGNILFKKNIKILKDETTLSLKYRLAKLACNSLSDFFQLVESKNLLGTAQSEKENFKYRLKNNSDLIHKEQKISEIKNIINAYSGEEYEPFCIINKHKIYVLSYGEGGLNFNCKDGNIKFNKIRIKNKIYKGEGIEKILKKINI